ncbi:MAG: sarcosine oxidase subunit gamma family protein [Arenicellales bacterium]|nr:sarcosine oxidase subunit gamma family protein [Arenicellales bacterium]
MADAFQPVKYSPLSELPLPAGGIELSERHDIGKVNVRGNPEDAAFTVAVEKVLGVELPLVSNTTTSTEEYTVFWLGPNEWLIHCGENKQTDLTVALQESLQGQHVAITDVSDYYLVIRITGAKAREILSKGTPFDVHTSVFKQGDCAQTCFGHATILLHCVDENSVYDLQVRWSFAEYIWTYLVDGALEYK